MTYVYKEKNSGAYYHWYCEDSKTLENASIFDENNIKDYGDYISFNYRKTSYVQESRKYKLQKLNEENI